MAAVPGARVIPEADSRLAGSLAAEAGRVLLALRRDGADWPLDQLKDAGDAAAHDFLVSSLADQAPGDAVLSEEGKDDAARLDAERVWIVDPLDGTREYGEGRDDWAVHVALWSRQAGSNGGLIAGAISLPARDLVLDTGRPPTLPAPGGGTAIRVAVSRTRPPALLDALAEQLPLEYVPMGSAGVKIASVLLGETDAYVHAGGQYEWDSAAPVAVALAAGLHASRIDGSPLTYNQADPSLPDLLVCRPELAAGLLDAIAGAR